MAFIQNTPDNYTPGNRTDRHGNPRSPIVREPKTLPYHEFLAPVAIGAVCLIGGLGYILGNAETRPMDAALTGIGLGAAVVYVPYSQAMKDRDSRIAKLTQATSEAKLTVDELNARMTQATSELAQVPRLQESLDALNQRLTEASTAVQFTKDALSHQTDRANGLEATREALESQVAVVLCAWELALQEIQVIRADSEAQVTQMTAEFEVAKETFIQETQGIIDGLNEEIDALNAEVANYPVMLEAAIAAGKAENRTLREQLDRCTQSLGDLTKPRSLSGASHSTTVANRVIETLMKRGQTCDPERLEDLGNLFHLWLKPRTGTIRELESLTDTIALDLGLKSEPTVTLDDGMAKLTVVHSAEAATTTKEPKEPKEQKDWLPGTIMKEKSGSLRPYHLKVAGETESGKSTLVKNAIDIFRAEIPGLQVELGDPLYETGESDWEGWQPTATNDDAVFQLLCDWGDAVQKRTDNPEEPQNPVLVVIDDIDTLAADFNTAKEDYPVTKAVQKILKRGRHVGVWLLLIGQSAYCSNLKLTLGDLRNAVNICIGTTIPKGLSNSQLDNSRESKWLSRYYDLQEKGERFLAWIAPPQTPGFIATLPVPNAYASKVTEDSEANLLAQGKSIPEVIKELYGLNPSRSKVYKAHKKRLESKASLVTR